MGLFERLGRWVARTIGRRTGPPPGEPATKDAAPAAAPDTAQLDARRQELDALQQRAHRSWEDAGALLAEWHERWCNLRLNRGRETFRTFQTERMDRCAVEPAEPARVRYAVEHAKRRLRENQDVGLDAMSACMKHVRDVFEWQHGAVLAALHEMDAGAGAAAAAEIAELRERLADLDPSLPEYEREHLDNP